MKKIFLVPALTVVILASIVILGVFGGADKAKKDLLPPEVYGEIFSRYAEEIADIEAEYGVEITGYTEAESDLLKQAAVDVFGTEKFDRRSQLVTELALEEDKRA